MTAYGIIEFGKIGQRLARHVPAAVVLVRPRHAEEAVRLVGRERVCTTLEAFLAHKPPIAVECASHQWLAERGATVLAAGIDLVPLSLTAFAAPDVEHRLVAAAEAGPGRLRLVPGGVERSTCWRRREEACAVSFTVRSSRPPCGGSPASALADLDAVVARQVILRGSVRELARTFTDNLNTSVGVAGRTGA